MNYNFSRMLNFIFLSGQNRAEFIQLNKIKITESDPMSEIEEIVSGLTIILFLFSLYYYILFRHILNKRSAKKDFDRVASEMGLFKTPSEDPLDSALTYSGRVKGYDVSITPEEYNKFRIKLKSGPKIWLIKISWFQYLTGGPDLPKRLAKKNMVPFSFANKLFHSQFAESSIAENLKKADQSVELLAKLKNKWGLKMNGIKVDELFIDAVPSRGFSNKMHSLSGKQLKEFLPDLIALAEMFDNLPELSSSRTS